MSWLKLHNDIINDPKMRALAFDDRWHFVALLVLTNDGTLDEPTEVRDVLIEVALGVHGIDLVNVKKRLSRLRLIGEDWKPTQWDARQVAKDKTGAERQKKFREKQTLSKVSRDVTRDVTVMLRVEEEEEEEVRINNVAFTEFWKFYPKKKGDKGKANKKFSALKPDLQELIIANVKTRIKKDKQWLAGYAPYPLTFLNGSLWNEEWEPAIKSSNGRANPLQFVQGVDY